MSQESITIGKTTVFWGENGTGKSLVCDFITSLVHKDYLDRWVKKPNSINATVEIEFMGQELLTFVINIRDQKIKYYIDGRETPLIYSPYYVLYIDQLFKYDSDSEMDIIEQMAHYYRLTRYEFTNVLNFMGSYSKFFIEDIQVVSSEIIIKVNLKSGSIPYLDLSGGEQRIVIIEIALRIAMFFQKFKPTLLILDNIFGVLDISKVNQLLNMFRTGEFKFQSILTFSYIDPKLDFTGLDIWDFIEDQKVVIIRKRSNEV